MSEHAYAVILAGGRGERFWPLSTSKRPKQLHTLVGDRTMLSLAVQRLEGLIPPERVMVITNGDLVEATAMAAPELPPENIIGEPVGRDTAAAVALAAGLVQARDPKGVFCILTADHIIGELDVFRQTLRSSVELAAAQDVLITIGIRPAEPSTAYGYIEAGEALPESAAIEFRKANRFVEKPDRETASTYVEQGNYFWNAGMFIWSVDSVIKAFAAHTPHLVELIDTLRPSIGTDGFAPALASAYEGLEKISIDYALMEHADNIVMAVGTFPWDDVGSWTALANHFEADAAGNTGIGECELLDAKNNIVFSKDHVTALIGVEDLMVIQAEGVTLVCPKDHAQDVKKLVVQLREQGHREEYL